MGKFKLGARVRDAEGDIGEIVSKRKGERLVRYEDTDYGEIWNTKDRLTVVDEPGESGEVVPAAFKVGDRVRLLNNNGGVARWGKKGECGTVLRVTPESTEVHAEFDNSGKWYAQFHDIERLPTFRKGDRAISQNGDCVTVESDVDSAAHVWVSHGTTKWRTPVSWLTKWEPKVGDRVNWTRVRGEFDGSTVEAYDGVYDFKLRATNGNYTYVFSYELEPLPVAPQPAVMTEDVSDLWRPVVGKFGKTRDGRKVGPIGATNHYKWNFDGKLEGGDSAYYNDDGSCPYMPHRDLISEWPEPVAVAEATTTPGVKAGDMVRRVADGYKSVCPIGFETTITKVDGSTIWYLDINGEDTSSGSGHSVWEVLSTLEPAAPQAKFKVGDRVKIDDDDDRDVATVVSRNHKGEMALKWDHLPSQGAEWWKDSELVHAGALAIGTRVTLNAPARITAIHDGKASLKLATGGSYTLPLAALSPTN